MSHTFLSLREKYPSAAKGDEGLVNSNGAFREALTCLANVSASIRLGLSSQRERNVVATCLANVSASDTPP
jgi:hypothetical protein